MAVDMIGTYALTIGCTECGAPIGVRCAAECASDEVTRCGDVPGPGDVVFCANELTHPARRVHDGKAVVSVVDHVAREPHAAVCRAAGKAPEDMIRYGVEFADGSGTWASAREIGRA